MRKNLRKTLLTLLAVTAMAVIFCFGAGALDKTGQCGDNVNWKYNSKTGELVISGEGAMYDYYPSYYDNEIYTDCPFFESDIKSVVIKSGVTTIGDGMFIGSSITSVTIPDSVTTIGGRVFEYCHDLQSITVDKNNKYYCVDEYGVLFDKNKTKLIQYPISNTYEEYTIPDSVTTIGKTAFYGCDNLKSVTFGNNIKSIDEGAFEDCALQKINITDMASWCEIDFASTCIDGFYNEDYVYDSNPLRSADLYLNGKKVTNVVIPDGVTSIGEGAFYGYKDLVSITIPDSVDSIGYNAFEDCTGLKSIYISDMAKWCQFEFYIESRYCDPGEWHFYSNPLENADLYLNGKKVTELVIPDGVKKIGKGAFAGYDKLTSVTIPDSVDSIGFLAFEGCTGIKKVLISDLAQWCNIDQGMYHDYASGYQFSGPLGYCADLYLNGKKVTNLVIPDGVKKISEGVFFGCKSITSVTIPDSVTAVGRYAFEGTGYYDDENNWENGLLYINKHLIMASDIKNATIKQGTKTIADSAFAECRSLTSVTIPDSVISIGNALFEDYYDDLQDIYYTGTKTDWNNISVDKKSNEILFNATIHYNHIHSYTAKTTKAATYTKTGVKTYTCSCGDSYTKKIAKKTLGTTSKITATKTSSSVTLKWNKVSGATGYRIFQKVNGDWKKLTDTTKLTYTIKKLKANTKYTFAVRAYVTKSGKTTLAPKYKTLAVTTTSSSSKPAQVKNVKATPTATTVKLTWSKISGVKGYEIFSYNSKTKKYTSLGKTTSTTYTVKKLKANTSYQYAVRAYKVSNKKNVYGKVSSVVKVTTLLATPTLKVTSTKGKANLTWNNIAGESGYAIYMATSKNGKYTHLANYKANSTKATKSNLKSGKTYYFKIRAYKKASGKTTYSAYSAVKSVKIK